MIKSLRRACDLTLVMVVVAFVSLPVEAHDDHQRGSIEVTAPIEGAPVFVEGFLVGQVPAHVTGLPPGDYRVVVKGFEGGDFVEDVTLEEGQTVSVSAEAPATASWASPRRAEDDWVAVAKDDQKRLEKAEAAKPLRGYTRLELANFLVKSDETVQPEHLFSLFGNLLRGIEDRKKLRELELATNYSSGGSDRWVSQEGSNEPTMILSGVITRYDPGSRAKRYFVGFGAGRTRIYCLFRLVDKATDEVLLERMENGSISGGLFGGSGSGATKELGQDIAKAIEREW